MSCDRPAGSSPSQAARPEAQGFERSLMARLSWLGRPLRTLLHEPGPVQAAHPFPCVPISSGTSMPSPMPISPSFVAATGYLTVAERPLELAAFSGVGTGAVGSRRRRLFMRSGHVIWAISTAASVGRQLAASGGAGQHDRGARAGTGGTCGVRGCRLCSLGRQRYVRFGTCPAAAVEPREAPL